MCEAKCHVHQAPECKAMTQSSYDPEALLKRAELWRAEAAVALIEEVRAFCLAEADQCERRVQKARLTPILREANDRQRNQAKQPRSPLSRADKRGSLNTLTK